MLRNYGTEVETTTNKHKTEDSKQFNIFYELSLLKPL